MLDKETLMRTVQNYAEAVKKEVSPDAIVLFGSYAKGNAREESDIDIGIFMNGFKGDWRETSSKLWNIAYDISWDLEPHLCDLTDDGLGFAHHVLATGQIIYQASA